MDKRRLVKKLMCVILASFILSFGVYNFYYQNGITEGGVLGIFLILKNVFNLDLSITSILLDGGLILLGYKIFGKNFLGFTIFSSLSFSFFTAIFERLGFIVSISDNLVAAILGGICVGIGCGLIILVGGAAGGDDVIALIISKFTKLPIGVVYLFTDISVLLMSLVYLPLNKMLYSVVAVIISGQIINILYKFKAVDKEDSKEKVKSGQTIVA